MNVIIRRTESNIRTRKAVPHLNTLVSVPREGSLKLTVALSQRKSDMENQGPPQLEARREMALTSL